MRLRIIGPIPVEHIRVLSKLSLGRDHFGGRIHQLHHRVDLGDVGGGPDVGARLHRQHLHAVGTERDALATQIKTALGAAAFAGQALNEQQAKAWIDQAQSLLDRAAALKAG